MAQYINTSKQGQEVCTVAAVRHQSPSFSQVVPAIGELSVAMCIALLLLHTGCALHDLQHLIREH